MAHHNNEFDSKLKSYTFGFGLSVALTVLAFMLTISESLSKNTIIASILLLAIIQLFVQLVFFLHLSRKGDSKWNTLMFIMAAWAVVTLVIGSIWIMNNLDYNMMPKEAEKKLLEEEGYR